MSGSDTHPDVVVGIVGAGAMGRGIAQVAAAAGFPTLLYDADTSQVGAAIDFISGMLRRAAEKGSMSAEAAEAAVTRLTAAGGLEALAPCQLVIEAIVENLDVKRELFSRLEGVVAPGCVLATNTSSLSVTDVAAACERPERVAGFHFFIPAPLMKLVEVIDGVRTAPATVDFLMGIAGRMGHAAVKVTDSPGFLVNHAGRGYLTESLAILGEGIATPPDIDRIMTAAGFRMGPFTLMDLTGLDVTLPALEAVFAGFYGDPRFRPSPLARRRYRAGVLGRKSNGGWYGYDGSRQLMPDEQPAPADRPSSVWISSVDTGGRSAVLAAIGGSGVTVEGGTRPTARALCVVTPSGQDATTSALEQDLDPRRTVAVDTFLGLAGRRTAMTTPITDPAYARAAHGLFAADGSPVTMIKDSPGFVAPRILAMIVNTACGIAQQGIAAPGDIDLAVNVGLGYPRGPLAWGDALGPARILGLLDSLYAFYRDPRYRPVPWLTRRARLGVSLLTPPT